MKGGKIEKIMVKNTRRNTGKRRQKQEQRKR